MLCQNRDKQSSDMDEVHSTREVNGPSFEHDELYGLEQKPQDMIDEAIMESFPCSDPPAYTRTHA